MGENGHETFSKDDKKDTIKTQKDAAGGRV